MLDAKESVANLLKDDKNARSTCAISHDVITTLVAKFLEERKALARTVSW